MFKKRPKAQKVSGLSEIDDLPRALSPFLEIQSWKAFLSANSSAPTTSPAVVTAVPPAESSRLRSEEETMAAERWPGSVALGGKI